MKILDLTSYVSGKSIRLNADQIVSFSPHDQVSEAPEDGTAITLVTNKTLYVKESPDSVDDAISVLYQRFYSKIDPDEILKSNP